MTWDHSRGFTSVAAASQRFHELHPHIDIQWSKRSLQAFADRPLGELAEAYDLLVIDHPWTGYASAHGVLLPLENYLTEELLTDLAANSVGRSFESYTFDDSLWALAIDAACPVSARRIDLLERAGVAAPLSFDDLIALGKRGLVCCPSIPLDVYGNFLNLCVAAGETIFPNDESVVSREAGLVALDRLRRLADVVPQEFFELNPIQTLEVMSQSDEFAYAPYTYGYVNYTRRGYAPHRLAFGDVIGIEAGRPGATMLGGTGLAISARCDAPEIAAQFLAFAASLQTQGGVFLQAGGQPGHRSVWEDQAANFATSNFFSDTLPTLDRAFVRPRYPGYLNFQDRVGDVIHDYLRDGGQPGAVLDCVDAMFRESLQYA